jgi:hypothetical protein
MCSVGAAAGERRLATALTRSCGNTERVDNLRPDPVYVDERGGTESVPMCPCKKMCRTVIE